MAKKKSRSRKDTRGKKKVIKKVKKEKEILKKLEEEKNKAKHNHTSAVKDEVARFLSKRNGNKKRR